MPNKYTSIFKKIPHFKTQVEKYNAVLQGRTDAGNSDWVSSIGTCSALELKSLRAVNNIQLY